MCTKQLGWTFCPLQNHKRETVALTDVLFQQKTFGSETPVKHNNSQDICTWLRIEIKPPSEITVPALTL